MFTMINFLIMTVAAMATYYFMTSRAIVGICLGLLLVAYLLISIAEDVREYKENR